MTIRLLRSRHLLHRGRWRCAESGSGLRQGRALHMDNAHPLVGGKGKVLENGGWASRGFGVTAVAEYRTSRAQSAAAEAAELDPAEQRSPPSDKVMRLVDEISALTLLEVCDMTKLLKQRLGLSDMPMGMPMMNMGGGGAAAAAKVEEQVPEKTAFDLKLEKFDAASKIKIIKEVRTFTALGLKEAKELVEKTPCILKKGVTREEAEQIIEKVKAVGGTVVME